MVHSSWDQFCWILLCLSHLFLSRIVLKPQVNLSETSFNSPYPLWYEGHPLCTPSNAPGWLLSLSSSGLPIWGCAHGLAFCRPLPHSVFFGSRKEQQCITLLHCKFVRFTRVPFSLKTLVFPENHHINYIAEKILRGHSHLFLWWINRQSDALTVAWYNSSDVGIHLKENIQNKKTIETVPHLGSVGEKYNHRNLCN